MICFFIKTVKECTTKNMLSKSLIWKIWTFSLGAVIYLLNLFCNSTDSAIRELTANLLAKMTTERLIGPVLRITLSKFLPTLFLDAMKDSPEAAVHMFEGSESLFFLFNNIWLCHLPYNGECHFATFFHLH